MNKVLGKYIMVLLLSMVVTICCFTMSAQEFPRVSENFRDFNNKASRSAFSLVKDRDGFLWVSSLLEVARYDGSKFDYYNLIDGDIIQDGDGRQVTITSGEGGDIWAFCDKGRIYFYSADSDSFELYVDLKLHDSFLLINDIYVIDGGIYVASSKGLWLINLDGEVSLISSDKINYNAITKGADNCLFIGRDRGVISLDVVTNSVTDLDINIDSGVTTLYYEPSAGNLWIGSFDAGLLIYNIGSECRVAPSDNSEIPAYPIRVITPLDSTTMLVGIDGCGVYSVNRNNYNSQLFASQDNSLATIPSNKVYDILVDDGNIWVATYTAGVTLLRSNLKSCTELTIPYSDTEDGAVNQIYAILEDRDGDIWYATNKGVAIYYTKQRRWKHFLQQKNTFLALAESENGDIYAGGYATGMYKIDKRRGVAIPITTDKSNSPDCIYSLTFDSEGDLFVGRLVLPMISISKSGEIVTYPIINVNAIIEIDNNRMVVATSNGFYILDKDTHEVTQYFSDPERLGLKSSSQITSILYRDGALWFGTDGGGLCVMDMVSGEIENFSIENGLPSNFIYTIADSDEGNLIWCSTMNGIFCFDVESRQHKFNIVELYSRSFLPASVTKLSDGNIAFGGYGNVISVDPSKNYNGEISMDKRIIFTKLNIFYKPILKSQNPEILPLPIDKVEGIQLRYNQNSLMLEFAVVDLYHRDSYYCEYILDGFDSNWNRRETGNNINYTNLPSGDYTLRIKAYSIEIGVEVSERTLPISISKPIWATYWAWAIYIIIVGIILYFVLLFIKERLLRNQSRDRIKILLSIFHDIRTPLSLVLTPLNSINTSILNESERKKVDEAQKNGAKFNGMVEELLDFNKEYIDIGQKGKLTKDLCDVKQLLKQRVAQYEHIAAERGVLFNMEFPSDNIYLEANGATLNRILDNILSNAIKYSFNNSEVIVRVTSNYNNLVISVQDFGIGIPEKEQKQLYKGVVRASNAKRFSSKGKGMGSLLTHAYVKKLGAELSFESQEAVGSIFSISFSSRKFNFFTYNKTTNTEIKSSRNSSKPNVAGLQRVLVVDDDPVMLNYLIDNLANIYNVIGATSAEEALTLLQREMVDLVISDIVMDGMRGDELCYEIKNNIASSHIYVMLVTAESDTTQKLKALESGANDYLTKPYSIDELLLRVHRALETQQRLKQRFIEQSNLPQINSELPSAPLEENELNNITALDDKFLIKAIKIVTDNIGNNDFNINIMCQELAMSRTLVYEKLRALTQQSPSEFIRSIKLRRAYELLQTGKYSVTQVAEMTGFNDVKYFSVLFKKYYNCSPSKLSE